MKPGFPHSSVGKESACNAGDFVIIRELTLEKDPMSAVNVGNLLSLGLISIIIKEFILEKDHMSVVNVGNPLSKEITS